MNSKEEKFFDLPTILALIGLIIALPALLIGIFFNKKFDITDKILLVLSSLPVIIYGLFYLCIHVLLFSIRCLAPRSNDCFFMILLAISFVKNVILKR